MDAAESSQPSTSTSRWATWFSSSSSADSNNPSAANPAPSTPTTLSASFRKRSGFLARRGDSTSSSNGDASNALNAAGVSAVSLDSSSSRVSGAASSSDSSLDEPEVNDDDADLDEDSLMWEAQMALISHEYKSAMRLLKKAVKLGSAAACLSLANILIKGLSCKDDSAHHTVHSDPTEAGAYYIRGLELLHQRNCRTTPAAGQSSNNQEEEHEEDDDDDERDSARELQDSDMETLQDLTTGLCSLYRLGRLRPSSEGHNYNTTATEKGKAREEEVSSGSHIEGKRRLGLWDRGGTVSLHLIPHIHKLLGITIILEDTANGDTTPVNRPTLSSRSSSGDANSTTSDSTAHPHSKLKKTVSFTRLPPKHKSTLDPVATRQARAALIHLYYISALVAFSSTDAEIKAQARSHWQSIMYVRKLAGGNGGGSREADELISKAKIRLEMLQDPVQVRDNLSSSTNGHKGEKNKLLAKIDIPDKAKDLTLQHMLSPPISAADIPNPLSSFDLSAPASSIVMDGKAVLNGIRPRPAKRRTTSGPKAPKQNGHIGKSSEINGSTNLPKPSDIATPKTGLLPPAPLSSDPSIISAVSSANSRRSKAKFSLPDSPTSTIRSYTSHTNKGSRSRGNSNASMLSGIEGVSTQTRTHLGVPWLVKRPSSSTSLSLSTPNLPKSHLETDHIPSSSPSPKSGKKKPEVRPSYTGRKWCPILTTPPVSTFISKTSLLSPQSAAVPLKKNSTSVLDLPHLSVRQASNTTRSQSFAHLLFPRYGEHRQGSIASLASLQKGIKSSFSNLRSFFVAEPVSTTVSSHAEEAESDEENDEETAANEPLEKDSEEQFKVVQIKLQEAAQRHDEALAEVQYWAELDKAESEPADSWNSPLPNVPSLTDAESEDVASPIIDLHTPPGATRMDTSLEHTSSPKFSYPLSYTLPSDRLLPHLSSRMLPPAVPPGTPSSHMNAPRRNANGRRAFATLEGGGLGIPSSRASPSSSAPQTPLHNELDENGEIPGPLKIDPLLAALEAASRVNVKTRCAVCGKTGVNFPKARDGRTYCARECRIAAQEEEARESPIR